VYPSCFSTTFFPNVSAIRLCFFPVASISPPPIGVGEQIPREGCQWHHKIESAAPQQSDSGSWPFLVVSTMKSFKWWAPVTRSLSLSLSFSHSPPSLLPSSQVYLFCNWTLHFGPKIPNPCRHFSNPWETVLPTPPLVDASHATASFNQVLL
jgi:hypothetical protein